MAVYFRGSITDRQIIDLDGLTDDARKVYLISLAREEAQRRQITGYVFNDIRFELSHHTDVELARAAMRKTHIEDFSYVRPSPGSELVELTDANLSDLIFGYSSLRQAYLIAEYDLAHEIHTGRIRNVEALKAWSRWPDLEKDRA